MGNNLYHTDSNKAPAHTSHESAKGVRINSGPFIGIVKNNTDPSRSGKLQVWIAELGGKEDDNGSWRTVGYSTPFYGVTPQEVRSKGQDFAGSPHSYGMWFVPPDIGVKVLCTFVNGDPFKGYWFACIPEWPNMQMVPGLSAPVSKKGAFPVVEYNDQDPASAGTVNQFFARAATPHTVQQQIYTKQGLISDPMRGPGTSSAFRETPSRVFGISTPGVPLNENDQDVVSSETGSVEDVVRGRKGGHTFVMDDGDAQGKNKQFKMRSSTGHTILMSDTGGFIYIINAAGTAWIEMDAQGAVNVYSGAQIQLSANSGINIDSKGAIKIHGKSVDIKSDGNVNIEGKDVNVKASGSAKVSGGKDVSLKGSKAFLTGDICASISGGTHVDIGGACVKIGTSASKATAAGGATAPQNMPTKEPWSGHKGGASGASQPTAQPSYESTAGLPGGSGQYGAANNFGSSNIQQNYAELPNDIGPVKYTTGFQGSTTGQASMYTTSVNTPTNIVANAVGNAVGNTFANAIFDTKATSYKNIAPIANFTYQPGATYNATYNLQGGSIDTSDWTPSEKQNNPGKLVYEKTDARAIGNSNGLAVYNKAEDGIAQLVVTIQRYLNQPSLGSSDKNLQTIIAKLLKTDPTSGEAYYAVRTVSNMTGISGNAFLNMTDPRTCISVTTAIIQYMQMNRIIYTFEQMVSGCAMGLGVSAITFANNLVGGATSTSNGYGSPGTSTYVPVTNPVLSKGGGSTAAQILTNIGYNVVTNLVSKAVSTSINEVSAVVTGSNAVNSVFTGGGSVFSGGAGSTGVPNSVQNFQVGDISNIVGSKTIGGTTECVGIATGVFGKDAIGASSQWQGTGTGLMDAQGSVPVGTACATFNFNGNYGPPNSPGGASGVSHTILITGYVDANRQPLPQAAYNTDGTVKVEYRGQIAGVQAAEQYNASGGVIRSQIYMNGANGATKNANNYQPIVKNGQQFTAKVLPNQQATKDTSINDTTKTPTPPDRPEEFGKSPSTKDNESAAKSVDAKDVDGAKTTTTPEAGTTTAEPIKEGTNIQATQTQIAAVDNKIELGKEISAVQTELINKNKEIIDDNKTQAQDLRNQQADVRAQQQEVQEKYDTGKITQAEYKSQMGALNTQNQSLGNQAAKLENEATDLTRQNEQYAADRDQTDATVQKFQDQKATLQEKELNQARDLDSAEQAATQNSKAQTDQIDSKTTGEPEVNGPGEFTVNYKTPVDNTPVSNSNSGTTGDGTTENSISDRDASTSTVVTSQPDFNGPDQFTPGGFAPDNNTTAAGNADNLGTSPNTTEYTPSTDSDYLGTTPTDIGTGQIQQNSIDQTVADSGDLSFSSSALTNNTAVNADASASDIGNLGSSGAVTGAAASVGSGSAITGGAMTTPQGAAATGAGALQC